MIRYRSKISLFVLLFTAFGCFKDLDTIPIDPDVITASAIYEDSGNYIKVLAKLYAGLAVTGQQGPAGQSDITSIDEGFGQYLRMYWYHQELTTDEAVIGWNDQTIKDFHSQTWSPSDGFTYAFYFRCNYQISVANEFLRETTDAKLTSRGVSDDIKRDVKTYRAEARFLRALSYWHLLDNFRNPPFTDESYVIGSPPPLQSNKETIYAYVESELKAIEADLTAPRAGDYGRADRAAAWMLLAKLYQNTEVYLGQNKAQECFNYCKKIMDAGYTLDPKYSHLFAADNHKSPEIIFPITFDGINTRTYGGTSFIIHAAIGGSMNPLTYGMSGGWGGTRTTKQMVGKFPTNSSSGTVVEFNPGTSFPAIYLPNSTQGFNAQETSNKLTARASNKVYEGYRYFEAGTEFRFAQFPSNSTWLGDNGANGSLETNGANISIPETGLYYFNVNLNDKTFLIEKRTITAQGSATNGSFVNMDYDPATGYVSTFTNLAVGSLKFYINGDNGLAYGDTGADALLELNGADINIPVADNYSINLDLHHQAFTYQLKLNSYDRRPFFYTDGQSLEINDITTFTDGIAVTKFRNITSDGKLGSDTDFPDTDFPMFRLGDVYLMAAECILRGAEGGDKQKAATYFNTVIERAWGGPANNTAANDLNLPLILDERARELYWECHRRTDLIRFGQFTDGSYLWDWKGGSQAGSTVGNFRNVFPIPYNDLVANPNMKQNAGY